jgi:hypothetical protein
MLCSSVSLMRSLSLSVANDIVDDDVVVVSYRIMFKLFLGSERIRKDPIRMSSVYSLSHL